MTRKKHWMDDGADAPVPTRKRSSQHEKSIVKRFGGRTTSNSGASFGENDVRTPQFDIEAKTTQGDGYRITEKELRAIRNKAAGGRIPAQIIRFEAYGTEYIIIQTTDFLDLSGFAFEE
jgi:hypothetical protein